MHWGILDFLELGSGFFRILGEAMAEGREVYTTERRKAHRELLLRKLPNALLTETLGKKEGTIAYDRVLDRFGVALGNRPASFFGSDEILGVQISPSNERVVFLTIEEWGKERDIVLRFASKVVARRWHELVEERTATCYPARIGGPRTI